LAAYERFFASPSSREALFNSIFISTATVVLSAAIGIPLAFILHRHDFRGGVFSGRWHRRRCFFRHLSASSRFSSSTVSGIISRSLQIALVWSGPGRDRAAFRLFCSFRLQHVRVLLHVHERGLDRVDAAMEEAARPLALQGWENCGVSSCLCLPSFVGARW
jgi:iron(III) transport system permease protein